MTDEIQIELIAYKKYLGEYYTSSKTAEVLDNELETIFARIMTFSKASSALSGHKQFGIFYELITYNLNNFLYFLPLNEPISLNISARNTCEALLKLIYTIDSPNKDFYKIGFRSMKDTKETLSCYNNLKNELDFVFKVYSETSEALHLKKKDTGTLFHILEQKLLAGPDKKMICKLSNDMEQCRLTLLKVLIYYDYGLTTAEKLNLCKYVSKSWTTEINKLH